MISAKAVGIICIGLFVFGLVALKGQGPSQKSGVGWEARSSAHNNLQDTYFVVVDAAHVKDRATYDQAVQRLCPSSKAGWPICRVAFYAPNDPVPPASITPIGILIPEGYRRVLAIYSTTQDAAPGEIGVWDCERAGEAGAPAGALCGAVRTYFDAVTRLSLRASRSVGCGWPHYDADIEGVRRFIQQVPNNEQRVLYERVSALFYGSGSSRPDDLADCTRLRSNIEADAVNARKVLGVVPPPPQSVLNPQRLRTPR